MRAAILAIGSELLGPEKLDTNSLRLTATLEAHGVELIGKAVVGDDEERIAAECQRWLAVADCVVATGGLGPTMDDLTRTAVARALGQQVAIDEDLVAELRRRFARYLRNMADVNIRQAEVISGAAVLTNRHGSAPGQRLEYEGSTLFLFPGVPREVEGMITDHLEPWLATHTAGERGRAVVRAIVKVASLAESEVEQRIQPLYERFGRQAIAVLASPGDVRVHLSARGTPAEAAARVAEMQAAASEQIGQAVYATHADSLLEDVVGDLLRAAGKTLTVAESCTGGLLAERLTRVAGSSAYFLGGAVSYSNPLKSRMLGVPEEMLIAHGAVSEPVARAMAAGIRTRQQSDYGIGITGVAGPGGGSEDKPVGTVHLALAGPGDGDMEHRRVRFPGDRQRVRLQTTQLALEMLRRDLLRRQSAA